MKKKLLALGSCLLLLTAAKCTDDADNKASEAQQQSLSEAQAEVGMPAITNFQEKRMLKQIYEMRDQTIATHAYVMNSMRGCLVYLGQAVGYGMPYSAQYSSPEKVVYSGGDYRTMPQAEPNGVFMPSSAQGTWINLLNPETKKPEVIYVEPDVIVSPFKLTSQECR